MRPFTHVLLAAVFAAFTGIAAFAQITIGPEDPDTPEGGGDDLPVPCITCCNFYPVDPTCQLYCGCETPSLCPSFLGLQSPSVQADNIADIYRSIEETRTRMADTQRGQSLLSTWETHAERVSQLFRERPALAGRVGKALVSFWPTDIWSGGSAVVEREALQELRTIVQQIARADAQSDSSGLARTIRRQVLPRLDDSLIGRSHADAFQCFISDTGC